MNTFKADLHCHTTASDGTLTAEQVVRLAKEIGLSGLSITDHDSIDAYKDAIPLAKTLGIEMISGAEFSTMHKNTSIHILAYSFPLESSLIQEFCEKHRARRAKRNQAILDKLKIHNMPLSFDDVYACLDATNHTIGRPHIAQAMIKKGYVRTIQEAFKKYLGEKAPCYAHGESFSTEETIKLIHDAGGLAVIAHPHLIDHPKVLQELLELPFDGIECYYANFHQGEEDRWLKIAREKNWLVTGGSDFHGDIKPNIKLGASFIDHNTFLPLQKWHLTKNS